MITQALYELLIGVLGVTVGSLPTGPSLGINTAATSVVSGGFFSHFGWANDYVPLSEVVTGVGILVSLVGIMYLVRIGIWALEKFHVLGGAES